MALLGNRSVLHKSPGRFLSGTVASIERSNFNKPGMNRGRFMQLSKLAATPYGYAPGGGCWVPAQKGGGISSTNNARLSIDAAGAGSMGKNTVGECSISLSITGVGGLISSASGSASITVGSAGNIYATKAVSGAIALGVSAAGQLSAIGHTGGNAGVSLSANWTPYAIGWLSGTTEQTGLTVNGISAAVWQYLINGTEAQDLLSAAGAAGDPLLGTVEGTLTLRDVQRILLAALAGTTQKTGNTIAFKSLDGNTDRIAGSFDAESNRTGVILNAD